MAPTAPAIGQRENALALRPISRGDHEKSKLAAFIPSDGVTQHFEARHSCSFACVIKPSLRGQGRKLARVGRWPGLSPCPNAFDFRLGGKCQLNRPNLPPCFDVENDGFHGQFFITNRVNWGLSRSPRCLSSIIPP